MRVLCLHSRGSNAEIFQMQTGTFVMTTTLAANIKHSKLNIIAMIRGMLDDFTFDFAQGGLPHQRGKACRTYTR